MPGWGEMFMHLRVDDKQVKKDVERGLSEAKGDEAGKRVGDEFSGSFAERFRRGWPALHSRMVSDAGASGKASGDEAGRTFSQSFTQLAGGIARSFWQGYRNAAEPAQRDEQGRFTKGLGDAGRKAGDDAGKGFAAQFRKAISGLGRDAEREVSLAGRTVAGFSPGMLGIRPASKAGLIGGAVTAGLAAAPAAIAGAGALGVAGLGGGVLAGGFSAVQSQVSPLLQQRQAAQQAAAKATTPAQAQAAQQQLAGVNAQIAQLSPALQSIVKSETQIQDTWKKFATSLAPLFAGPVAQVARLFGQLTGPLHQLFAGAATLAKPLIDGLGNLAKQVLPLLGQAFRAVAPLVKPLLDGFTALLTGLLPGLITLLKAAQPAVAALAGVLGTLGKGVGDMLAALAPAIRASAVVFKALGDAVAALFPVIGQLAAVFATGLAPVFVQLAAAVKALAPFLVVVGKAVADLAGVMFGVLNAALSAIVKLLQAIAPALTQFAGMLSQIFTVLANKNVFQMLATAIENVVPILAQLINTVLGGLMPILPPLIDFMTRLAGMVAGALGNALKFVVPLLSQLATAVLGAIAKILPVILPPLLTLVNLIGAGLGRVLALIIPPLVNMGEILAGTLAKIIPQLVPPIEAMAKSLSGALLTALVKLIPPLAQIATALLQNLAAILPAVIPLVSALAVLFTQALAAVITAVANALAWLISQFSPRQLATIIQVTGALMSLKTVIGLLKDGWGLLMTAMKAGPALMGLVTNPVFLIIAAIALLAFGIFELVKHWSQVWGFIKQIAKDAWEFLTHGWGQFLFPALTLIRLAVEFVRTHWRDAWKNIQDIAHNFYTWLWTDFGAKIVSFFTKTVPAAFDFLIRGAKLFWAGMTGAFVAGWNAVWNHTLGPLIRFFTQTIPRMWADEVRGWKLIWTQLSGIFVAGWNAVWNHTLGPLIRFFTQTIPRMWGDEVRGWKKLWSDLGGVFKAGWDWIVTHVWNPVKTFITKTVPGWWQTGVKAIEGFWKKIGNVVRVPVNFLIGTVYGKGIEKFWNNIVARIPGIPKLPDVPLIPAFARGGRLPGFGGGDTRPALLEAGETVVDKYSSRLPFMVDAFKAAGVPGYQQGGPVSHSNPNVLPGAGSRFGPIPGASTSVFGDIGHFFGKVYDLGKIAAGVLTGNTTAAANALKDMIGVPKGTTGDLANMMLGIPKQIVKGLVGLLDNVFTSMGSVGTGDLGTGLGPSQAQMVAWFGGIADPSHEATVPFAGANIQVNKLVAGAVRQIGVQIARSSPGYIDPSQTGGFRTGIGASTSNIPYSMHQLGLAIDVNWNQNPYLGNAGSILRHPDIIAAFAQHGWFWGGNWGAGGRDQMHFQLRYPGKSGLAIGGGGGGGHGGVPANAGAIAAFLASHGANFNAIAGILGNIQQESGGDPMAGSNPPGRGLIQILGDPGGTLAQELSRTLAYINANGSIADINAHSPTPAAAALWFSNQYERPAASAANNPNRIASAIASAAAGYASGGVINEPIAGVGAYSRALYSFGERGREWVIPEGALGRGGGGQAPGPLVGSYTTAYYGTGDAAEAMRELAFTLRRVRQGAFFPAGS